MTSYNIKKHKVHLKSSLASFHIIILLVSTLSIGCTMRNYERTPLEELSSEIPTDFALVFAKGVISTDAFEFSITFNPQMDEFFWTRREPNKDNEIYNVRLSDGKWGKPEPFAFKAENGWDFEPHISPDGQRLYFGSLRPLPNNEKGSGLHQWVSTKTESGWTNPIPMESPFLDRRYTMYLTTSTNQNAYFTTGEEGDKPGDWVIYTSKFENNGYNSIKRMGEAINFEGTNIAHSYIAPDESYLIYDAERAEGFGDSDLYISFQRDGAWTKAINMGPKVNTHLTEMCPSVSPDQKYLFFHRGDEKQGDIYWIEFQSLKEQLELQSKHN